jgi:hypothetical protein
MDNKLSHIKENAEGVANVLKQIKTLLSLAGLALLIIGCLTAWIVYQSTSKSEWLLLTLAAFSFIIVGYILWLVSNVNQNKKQNKQIDSVDINKDFKYFFPNTLLQFTHKPVNTNNEIPVNSLRVSTVTFLSGGDITVKTSRDSTKRIIDSKSISNPITAISYGDGTSTGGSNTTFYGVKPNQQEILVVESNRIMPFGEVKAKPKDNDDLLKTLHNTILHTNFHEYAGTGATQKSWKLFS